MKSHRKGIMEEPGLLATEAQVWKLVELGFPREEVELWSRGEAQLQIGECMKAERDAERRLVQ